MCGIMIGYMAKLVTVIDKNKNKLVLLLNKRPKIVLRSVFSLLSNLLDYIQMCFKRSLVQR